jgi:hypothetical protein
MQNVSASLANLTLLPLAKGRLPTNLAAFPLLIKTSPKHHQSLMSAIGDLRRIRRVGGQNEVANNGERAVGVIRQSIR